MLGPSHAQPAADGPTNQQLTAAYCVGRDQEAIVGLGPLMPLQPPQYIAAANRYPGQSEADALEMGKKAAITQARANVQKRALIQVLNLQRWRFIAYLIATGALTDPNDFKASSSLNTTRDQGMSEQKQCASLRESRCSLSPSVPGTTPEQIKEEAQKYANCTNEIPVCTRKTRCDELDSELPF